MDMISSQAAQDASMLKGEFEKIPDIDLLRVDYARLFVGPYELFAPPYGSVYLEGDRRVMGESTMDAIDWYRNAGLDISKNFQDPPDHIAVELEFVYFLIFKEMESISNLDVEGTIRCLIQQGKFLERHLGAWVPEFADNVEKNAETEFYKSLARFTKVFVKKDLEERVALTVDDLVDCAAN